MTQAGGPAAINGFLYQIIHHLRWLADVTLAGKLDGQEITNALLVLEPRNGGDARAEAPGIFLVEQYKTRKNGTWALSDVESVLRDLRKAVPQSRPPSASYRFVTDGRAGKLSAFKAFLDDVKSVSCPEDLDDTKKRKFGRGLAVSNREFFAHIVGVTRSGTLRSNTEEEHAVVFYLLSHFDVEFGADGSSRAADIENFLRPFVSNLGDERSVREHLVGVVFENLSKGEMRLDSAGIDAMFRRVGLSPNRLRKMAGLAETMSMLRRRRIAPLKYEYQRDVRGVPAWAEGKPVLLITGESGAGKTWQLARLLEEYAKAGQIAILATGANTNEILLRMARDLWQAGLGETSDKSLDAIAEFMRELAPDGSTHRLTVAVDDIHDVDVARALIRQDWANWGMRLALTVPRPVARALILTEIDTVQIHEVGDFAVDELDALLRRSSRKWTELPPDLKKLLRNPILAGLYLELPYRSFLSAPRSEYEIFELFWKRIAARGGRGDEGIVTALAAHMHGGKAYPLPRPTWNEIGLTDEKALARLEAAGWLRTTDDGEVGLAHDRLLNWAVAKFLVRQFQLRRLSIESLAACLGGEGGEQDRQISQQLAYLPMDTCWLLAADEKNTRALGQIIARMEKSGTFGSHGERLYTHLLPTLGQRAVPILRERLDAIIAGSEGNHKIDNIGKAFANLAAQEVTELGATIESLLNTPSAKHAVAIAALTVAPDPRRLDRLWEIHQNRFKALDDRTDWSRHRDYQASFAAMAAGIEADTEWLRRRIFNADPQKEPVSELGYLLNGLEDPEAPAIWNETGDILIAKVPGSKPRSLLNCIARFSDGTKSDFVSKHLSHSEDFASGAALAALTVLDPVAAIDRLVHVQDFHRYLMRDHWLPGLLRSQPELTRQRIRELAEADPTGRRIIERLFAERPDDLNEEMLRFVLRDLERDLREHLDDAVKGDPIWLVQPLEFLGRITNPQLLGVLEGEAGGELESMIEMVACSRLQVNSNYYDPVLESARRLLILIGGEGIAALIKGELDSTHFWVRQGGLNWAFVRTDNGIVERLATIARHPVPRDPSGRPAHEPYQEFYHAMVALAALGPDTVLVEIIQHSSVLELPSDLPKLRAHRGPMPSALTYQSLQVLRGSTATKDSLLAALAIAWVSSDVAFISAVRAVLEQADPEGDVAKFACIALQELGDDSNDFARLALRLAHTQANEMWGVEALANMGGRGLQLLGTWLKTRDSWSFSKSDDLAIRALCNRHDTRDLAVDAAVDRCRRGQHLLAAPYDIAGEAAELTLREQILDKAIAAPSSAMTSPLRAIEGLAKFDIIRAVEAIELGLEAYPSIERQLCKLLARIAPETAAARLIDAATTIDRDSLRRAAGHALRRLDSAIVSAAFIERMTGTASDRKVVAGLAAWVQSSSVVDSLRRLADHDSAAEVRHAALIALERHRQEASIRQLFAAFPAATAERRWTLIVAIVEGAEPFLLSDPEDPLWRGKILTARVPHIFEHYAVLALTRRKQRAG